MGAQKTTTGGNATRRDSMGGLPKGSRTLWDDYTADGPRWTRRQSIAVSDRSTTFRTPQGAIC
jgi:hypothetical protein